MMRLDKLLANRGYCSRREVRLLIADERVLVGGQKPKAADIAVEPDTVTFDGEALDPGTGLLVMLHKPAGYVCARSNEGPSVFELLPQRWSLRNPPISCVGRLDKDTTGLLLLTDDGELLHRLTSPKHHVPKLYEVWLEQPLRGDEGKIFESGSLLLEGEDDPLKPAVLNVLESQRVLLTITEGRYHQVKRMFAAVGNTVTRLHRRSVGTWELGDLPEGDWQILEAN